MKRGLEDGVDPGRRSFLRGKLFTREGREDVRRQVQLLGPLPPALPLELVDRNPCEDCDYPCLYACEPAIIHLHPPGHRFGGMPFLSFESAACTFCNACVEVCPLEHRQPETQEPVGLGTAILDQGSCVAWNGVICLSCQSACDYQAVTMDPRSRPRIETQACTGCGACVGICPATAIRIPPPPIDAPSI